MQFSTVFTAAALVALARAGNVTVTTDITVTDFTTYCPEPTKFVVNNATVVVTEATTITITGPCVIPTTYVNTEGPDYTLNPAHKTQPNSEAATPATVAGQSTSAAAPATIAGQTANGANKVAAGAVAGLAAIGAALF